MRMANLANTTQISPASRVARFVDPSIRLLEALFIDSVLVHRFWHCHRRPNRSFFLRGRQFHVCARCTGVISGLILSPFAFLLHSNGAPLFVLFVLANALDGLTQLVQLRASNNWLRFGLGSGLGFTVLVALFTLVR